MKSMPDAHENRHLADIQNGKADKRPPREKPSARRKNASELESSAHSKDWRDAHLYPPE